MSETVQVQEGTSSKAASFIVSLRPDPQDKAGVELIVYGGPTGQ